MNIDSHLLIRFGGQVKNYKKREIIFVEGDPARNYFQIVSGEVKMINTNSEGKEFIQWVFSDGRSFGEPPLFANGVYPASALACRDSEIIKLPADRFFAMLEEVPQLKMDFLKVLSARLLQKAATAKTIMLSSPEARIINFLEDYKRRHSIEGEKVYVHHTRQEIGNFTGLRVETVIRTLQSIKNKNLVEISNRKLYY